VNLGNAALKTLFLGVHWVLNVIVWLVTIWVILSWVLFFLSQSSFRWRRRQVYAVLIQINEFFQRAAYPILRPFRRILPPYKTGGIDFSPLLLLLAVYMLQTFLNLAFGPILFSR